MVTARAARNAGTAGRLAIAAALVVLQAVVVPLPVRAEDDCITIADFATDPIGAFPPSWQVRKDEGKSVYSVQEEGGRRYLRAVSKGLGIQAALERAWDLDAYPVLAWSWRPRVFPAGADERSSGTNDSVLAVYMLVPYSRIRGPKAVKYIWSERVPVDTRLSSNGGLTQVRVLASGTEKRGEWVDERVNVLADYKQFFGTSETPKPAGIAVLTDSDDTHSVAEGDYANFRACRR
jgi:Protein of unknown function (DUF3047)